MTRIHFLRKMAQFVFGKQTNDTRNPFFKHILDIPKVYTLLPYTGYFRLLEKHRLHDNNGRPFSANDDQ